MTTANGKLIENLEMQLKRLVTELKDLDECRDELTPDEFDTIKEDLIEQFKEFQETLDRLQKGDTTLESKVSQMRNEIKNAIRTAFNTTEMIKMFVEQDSHELLNQLLSLEEEYKLKRIKLEDMEEKKTKILKRLQKQGYALSENDTKFLKEKSQIYLQSIDDADAEN
ncbi:protein LZIC-like [Culicoides brevitarsis]|uniref:protein LZIC-like n=1 Tax=Culicoides brevitarsis TaxID=469753 RepID=UPI00307BA1B3